MKKVDCIFYLVDNILYLYISKNNKINSYKMNNYIYEGRIIKPTFLIKKINEILKKEKIIKVFTGQKAIIIYEPHLKYIDKKIIIDAFDQCGFKDIKLVSTKSLLHKNKHYIEINNNYIIEYYQNNYLVFNINKYFNLNKIIKLITNKQSENIILLGISDKIDEISKIKNNLFYLENSETYYIDKVKKSKI